MPQDRRQFQDDDEQDGAKRNRTIRTLLFWVVFILLTVAVLRYIYGEDKQAQQIPYSTFLALVDSNRVVSTKFVEREIHGTLRDSLSVSVQGKTVKTMQFITQIPFDDPRLVGRLDSAKVAISAEEKGITWVTVLISVLPWILIIVFWLFLMRQMQGGQKGLFSFGKSRARRFTEDYPQVTFADVAGADEAKEELQEIIEFLKEPGKFKRLGGKIPKGALLLGPPGTGKTLLAKAVAGEAGRPFFSMSGSDFVEMFVGVGASRVRDLFTQGKIAAPCIIFIDEIDAVGRHRGAGLGGGHDEREQTLNQLLVEMDGFDTATGVILLAATNRPDVLDPALLRPGRFDRQIVVSLPDVRGREGILKVHTRTIPLAPDVDLAIIAQMTPGLSGADLANIVNEAALLGSRKNREAVTMQDFDEAQSKVLMGSERRSLSISPEEKAIVAFHEAGHALVAKLMPGSDPVQRVSIIPRGMSLGATYYLPKERFNFSKSYIASKLVHLLGGRAAELLKFHEETTGAGDDLDRATKLARKMICEWGMSEVLGPVTLGKGEQEVFLGRDFSSARDFSERTAEVIDHEIQRILTESQTKAMGLLRVHMDALEQVAALLLQKETIEGREIDACMGTMLPPVEEAVE